MNNIFRVGLGSPVSATIAAGLALCSIGSQALADPQSTPTITLAPYVLKSTILEEGATSAYRPWFESGARTGDLIEYHISEAGERCTSVAVGTFPPDDTGNAIACPYDNWSARDAFPDKIQSPDGTLIDEPEAATYWQTRNIFIFKDNETNNKVPFWWDELTIEQKQTLDPITCGLDVDGNCSAPNVDQESPQASIVLNYIRGDRSLERDKAGGIFRLRYSLLGSIINSRPVFAPVGDGVVVVGANDGMVHGFDATNGTELFGYIPSMLLPGLENLTATPYQFTYSADGELRYRNIAANQHIVAGGLGAGGKGLFVLDVTSPADPAVLFELSGNQGSHIDTNHYLPYLGHIYGRPTIARLPDNEWYVVAGNGYGSGAGPQLVLIRINDGNITTIAPSVALDAENGLSAPALVDVNGDGRVDFAYAGDLLGNLWRFDLTGGFASRLFAAGADKPITVEPDIARHPSGIGIMIYFGTGRLLNENDVADQATQSIFGIWDEDFVAAELPGNSLLVNTLTQLPGTWDNSTRFVRIVLEEQLPNWYDTGRNLGWRVDLPRAGERLIGRPQVRADRIQFITTHPPSYLESLVPGDGSWFIQLSLESGGSLNPPVPLYDLDRSGVLDEGDALLLQDDNTPDADPVAYYPLGLNLGPGNIAQPAFARVQQDIDAVFINALLLPVPPENDEGSGFGGDLDVTTDSPDGPMVNPHDAGHPRYSLYGTDYPDPSSPDSPPARGPMNMHLGADGPGGTVDGHHRAYDKVHGVNYVDFFDIEPRARRSLLRLDAGTLYQTVDANDDPIQQPFTAIRELNQPLETPWGDTLLGEDQRFIVVLSNADLSQGTELTIGCRTWNTFDYQEMITSQLKALTPPGALRDANGGSLIFSMASIRDEVCADGASPTLRVTITGRVGAEDVLHGTLPGCVNNTHGYDGYLKLPGTHPHITPNREQQASGYRWRNGALTMQLLAVNVDNSADYFLQRTNLPEGNRTIGNGGIFAAAFDVTRVQGQDIITPLEEPNGLLYEASVFWNFGDMWEFQQAGQPIQCYGSPLYNAATTNEIFGLNSGQYNGLVENLRVDQALLDAYADAIALLANAQTEEQVRFALMALAAIFDDQAGSWGRHEVLTLADFHRLRSYAHGDQFNLNLLDIDRDLFEPPPPVDVEVDGTPANVQDIELDLLPAAGPNYAPGRRSWIDITPVQ